MNRRDVIKCLMAGGVMTATGLWMPGEKLISIPSGKRWSEFKIYHSGPLRFTIVSEDTAEGLYSIDLQEEMSIAQLYREVCYLTPHSCIIGEAPMVEEHPNMYKMNDKWLIKNPWLLSDGTLSQNRGSEIWTSCYLGECNG